MSSSLNKVEAIDDMSKCVEVMKAFGLPTTGLNSLAEMKTTLNKHLEDLERISTRKVGEVSKPPISLLGDKYRLDSRYQFILVVF